VIPGEALLDKFLEKGFRLPGLAEISPNLVGAVSEGRRYLVIMGIYPIPDPVPSTDPGNALIAPFAAAHYYRNCVQKLKGLASELRGETGLSKQDIRIFSNSRLPERSIAAALGIGWVGRNGLLMNREYGSSFVLAGLLAALDSRTASRIVGIEDLPRISSLEAPQDPHRECGSCRACVSACPTGAITKEGGVRLERCLQFLATTTEELPGFARKVWDRRLYGCMDCQNSCPVNRHRGFHAVGEDLPREEYSIRELLREFASPSKKSLKEIFPGTALEAGWIPREAILRNLLFSAGNSRDTSLEPLIRSFLKETHPIVSRAAVLALDRISGNSTR